MTPRHERFRENQKTVELSGLGHLDLKVAYTDAGEGEPVVLLHGIPTWSFLYQEVIPLLAEERRVLVPDLLGYGYSDRRDRFDRSVRAQAAMILRFLDALGIERATIVGHDIGGAVALILVLEHPDRVERLVLSNIVAYDSWPSSSMVSLGDPFAWRDRTPAELAEFVAEDLAAGFADQERKEDFERDIVAPYSDEEGKTSLIRNASSLNTNHTMELVDLHEKITVPTLVLWGALDAWQPVSDGERLAQEIPNASLKRIEEAAHWVQQEAPEAFAREILDFLTG